MASQKCEEFGRVVDARVVFQLRIDVGDRVGDLGCSDRECAIAFLPGEEARFRKCYAQPARRIRFQFLDSY